jgi:hypothetical protein
MVRISIAPTGRTSSMSVTTGIEAVLGIMPESDKTHQETQYIPCLDCKRPGKIVYNTARKREKENLDPFYFDVGNMFQNCCKCDYSHLKS